MRASIIFKVWSTVVILFLAEYSDSQNMGWSIGSLSAAVGLVIHLPDWQSIS